MTPAVTLTHHELASRAGLEESYDLRAFRARWDATFAIGDPYFHPALSRDSDSYDFEIEETRVIYPSYPVYEHDRIRRILVVKLDHIGDFIVSPARNPAVAADCSLTGD